MDTLKRLILNAEKKVSWTKLGLWVVTLSGALLANHALPANFEMYLKIIMALGGGVGGVGLRDASDSDPIPSK